MNSTKIAILVCTNVIGGHEFQAVELARSLAEHVVVKVFVNRSEHSKLFLDAGLDVQITEEILLRAGNLLKQLVDGMSRRREIRELVRDLDQVIVCAGAVEAAVVAGVALRGYKPTLMYLPFFYDRVPVWGWKGYVYNCILARACRLFNRIITINRIQAQVIRTFSGVSTSVVTNKIRVVQPPIEQGPARLVFVGRLDYQKRIDELMLWLDADANPIKELVLIGDGPLRSELEQQAQTLTYLKCSFLGWRSHDEQDRLIRSSDILVLNSLLEGEPLVIREARARGMSIAARDIVGMRGVTARTERYTSQVELIRCILNTIKYVNSVNGKPVAAVLNEACLQRDVEIGKLISYVALGSRVGI